MEREQEKYVVRFFRFTFIASLGKKCNGKLSNMTFAIQKRLWMKEQKNDCQTDFCNWCILIRLIPVQRVGGQHKLAPKPEIGTKYWTGRNSKARWGFSLNGIGCCQWRPEAEVICKSKLPVGCHGRPKVDELLVLFKEKQTFCFRDQNQTGKEIVENEKEGNTLRVEDRRSHFRLRKRR